MDADKPVSPSDHTLSSSLTAWLSQPSTYPESTTTVRRVETHISCVFLTDQFAYKLKKPVRFDFLDFSTLEKRRAACDEELRLNRRLAPEVYLGLVAVRQTGVDEFVLDETADFSATTNGIVEWLVKMRKLPDDATLLAHIEAGTVSENQIDAVADRLAEFYRSATPLAIKPVDYREEIDRHVRANRAELLQPRHGLDTAAIRRIHGAQLRLLKLRPELFDERVHNERIIDGHGDLRPEHLYLLNPPVAIDCIEFSAEFRRLDVADELSFLATECDFAGAKETGQEIFNRTLSQLGDRPSAELVAFYRSYRACVRAKVAALRAAQMDVALRETALADARRHLQWADRYDRDLPGPILFVMCGLMGSGKSSVARLLAESLGAEILATDTIRRETFGASNEPAAYGQGTYTAENRRRVYDILFNRAAEHLGQGFSVILDGAFLKASLRDEALQLAQAQGLSSLVVRCTCPEEVAEVRIAARLAKGTDHSEARPELRAQQAAEQEFDPADPHLVEIDTTLAQDAQLVKLLAAL